ncbi:polar amino acid transport system permease protein [Labedella gwakjiensis]|uniref:Amino acid ABC transporter permease n=1 Tax=Labedella gwakjiensis TaxID=390269 RepID=A0A2P8GRC2_9MICO|nr:amino acid ABC transporter permease [Labedella gwakjiensis]PSL36502.1 polar amino acid transport system permease protein [Labedella gwakjiensis]RUQ85577.1 amino acid ABC transporter permease [Labedella gwakjiensis]
MTHDDAEGEVIASAPASQSFAPRVVPVRRYGQWVATALVLLAAALVAVSLLTNPRYQWELVFSYVLNAQILAGLVTTVWLTVIAMVLGVAIGVLMALARESSNVVVSTAASGYVAFFRGTPLLVQLIFWFNLAALYPVVSLGIPFGPTLFTESTNVLITPFMAAVLGLGLNEGAYMSEIVRAGLQSVDSGQTDAAHALGMKRSQTFRRIVLPQAMRVIIPPTGNETISMLKTTSLVSVIAIPELLWQAQAIYSRTYQVIPLLITVSLWYLLLTTVLSVGQYYLERHFSRGDARRTDRTLLGAISRGLVPRHTAAARPSADEPTETLSATRAAAQPAGRNDS